MANINDELNKIKNAVYGKDVRGSIHDGIDKINKETEFTTSKADGAVVQVDNIQGQVNQLVVEGDSSVEAAQARVDKDGETYATLKDRLDTENNEVNQQLADIAINVKKFGAKGDGVTDDTIPIHNALVFAIKNGYVLFFPEGIYIVDEIWYDFLENEELIIRGSGWNTVIRRKSNVVDENNRHHYMFSFWTVENANAGNVKVQVEDICLDSNHRGNPKPDGVEEYFYGRVMTFRVRARESGYIERILFDNVLLLDRISDHLSIPGISTSNVGSVELRNVHSKNISSKAVRGDVTISGAVRSLKITDCELDKVATELNESPSFKMLEQINSSNIKELQLTGQFETKLNGCSISRLTISNPKKITISQSTIYLHRNPIVNYTNNVTYSDCNFIYVPEGDSLPVFNFNYGLDVEFINCEFTILSDKLDHFPESYAIRLANTFNYKEIKLINCKFDERFSHIIQTVRGGKVTLIDVWFASAPDGHAIYAQGGNTSEGYSDFDIIVINGNFDNVKGHVLRFNGEGRLRFEGTLENIKTGFTHSGSGYQTSDIFSSRRILIESSDLGGGLKGDVAILKDLSNIQEGQSYEWIATRTHPSDAQWKATKIM